jgi:hypothetical protein
VEDLARIDLGCDDGRRDRDGGLDGLPWASPGAIEDRHGGADTGVRVFGLEPCAKRRDGLAGASASVFLASGSASSRRARFVSAPFAWPRRRSSGVSLWRGIFRGAQWTGSR